jgi:hypothetical protein
MLTATSTRFAMVARTRMAYVSTHNALRIYSKSRNPRNLLYMFIAMSTWPNIVDLTTEWGSRD